MVKKRFLLSLVFVLVLAQIDSVAASTGKPNVPPFKLTSLEGKSFTQEDLIGKVSLIIFWASWCHVCQEELPKAHQLHEAMKGKPFQILSIGFGDSKSKIQRYVKSHPDVFSFPVLYDVDNRVSAAFGARVTPTLFLFNQHGQLVVPFRGGGLFEHPKFQKILTDLF
ncbi:MAG: TlpA family protein disulfide reductase [Nitrospiria bacterium]